MADGTDNLCFTLHVVKAWFKIHQQSLCILVSEQLTGIGKLLELQHILRLCVDVHGSYYF